MSWFRIGLKTMVLDQSHGMVVSPANPLGFDSEIAHQVQLSKPVIAFATSKTSPKLPFFKLRKVLDSPEFLSFLAQPDVYNDVINCPSESARSSSDTLFFKENRASQRHDTESPELDRVDCRVLPLTTTVPWGRITAPNVVFTVILFHMFGYFMLARAFSMGETVVFMETFEFEEMLRAIGKYKITYMSVSPPLVVASLLLLGSCGVPLGKEVTERFKEKFPTVELVQGYGLTETGGGATRVKGPEEAARYGTVGRLSENMEAKIVDPVTGESLPPGQRGELWLRGPTVMKGYISDEKATAETLDSEGWLKTGDICYFDSEGFLYIVDRLKELIKYKAYQVPPAELEHLLHSHPEIADAAVISYPDEEAGQVPMAYVVRNPGSSITEAQVMDFIAKQVAPYKKIRRVSFIDSIPKSPAGKILRRELVNHSLSGASSKL
ncbi:hypothetical protein CRYUN_Cryun13aG0019100 [Craigia yunnanensis]